MGKPKMSIYSYACSIITSSHPYPDDGHRTVRQVLAYLRLILFDILPKAVASRPVRPTHDRLLALVVFLCYVIFWCNMIHKLLLWFIQMHLISDTIKVPCFYFGKMKGVDVLWWQALSRISRALPDVVGNFLTWEL